MIINLSPVNGGSKVEASVRGDAITVNGTEFDFSSVLDGDTIRGFYIPGMVFAGEVGRRDGEIYLTLIFPVGPNPSQSVAFPEPIHVINDGPVYLPRDPEPETPEIDFKAIMEAMKNDLEA